MAGNYILTLCFIIVEIILSITLVLTKVHHCYTATVFFITRSRPINVLNSYFGSFQELLRFFNLKKWKVLLSQKYLRFVNGKKWDKW